MRSSPSLRNRPRLPPLRARRPSSSTNALGERPQPVKGHFDVFAIFVKFYVIGGLEERKMDRILERNRVRAVLECDGYVLLRNAVDEGVVKPRHRTQLAARDDFYH